MKIKRTMLVIINKIPRKKYAAKGQQLGIGDNIATSHYFGATYIGGVTNSTPGG